MSRCIGRPPLSEFATQRPPRHAKLRIQTRSANRLEDRSTLFEHVRVKEYIYDDVEPKEHGINTRLHRDYSIIDSDEVKGVHPCSSQGSHSRPCGEAQAFLHSHRFFYPRQAEELTPPQVLLPDGRALAGATRQHRFEVARLRGEPSLYELLRVLCERTEECALKISIVQRLDVHGDLRGQHEV